MNDKEIEVVRKIVELEHGEYESNDDSPDCVFKAKENEYGPCGGVTYSDGFSIPLGEYNGKKFEGIVVPIPVCSAHYDVMKLSFERTGMYQWTKGILAWH